MAEPRNNSEDKLLKRLRVASGAVCLGLLALLGTADTLGRLFVDPGFHVSEILFGTLMGGILAFAGVEALVRLPKKDPPP